MKTINWKVRIKNKAFWLALVPAVLLIIQQVAIIFGYELDFGELGNQLRDVINTLFFILALLGIVNDPTTKGLSDSNRALTYDKPKED
jgi:phi LC3 family holin